MLRPVLLGLAGLATSSCSAVEGDPHRFEQMAQYVADIPLDGGAAGPARAAANSGLRPALATTEAVVNPGALRVEVLDPHDLWDARDAGLRGAVEAAAPALIEAAAPVVTEAVVQRVSAEMPARRIAPPTPRQVARTTLQLGAFASPAAAQRAWGRIADAGHGVAELTPVFEAVEVDGRSLTRLKVSAPVDDARAVCRAADAAKLGCLRRG
ncbi:SPOR domain-containing protein [Brevundimonas sp. NIBR11]|uniref:SPOR domain-containing protein n=1 Tax=Brevundimonas sp. NIBR11 TaxID=3015999 RepID=UPI0022F116FF|nr:SPOR domain-containing protein [Brevundimonas sp. NIBR11]